MSEQTPRTLNHFAFFKFKEAYFTIPSSERGQFQKDFLGGLRNASDNADVYQIYPTMMDTDVLVWSAITANESTAAAKFFTTFSKATNPCRHLVEPVHTLWGFTQPSQYTKTRSAQEIDPFANGRKTYLVIYPFTKTIDWYLMSREARQGMMNEHIKIGKQYPEIRQLLLYSFGLQNQEFVVVYETDDLTQFSDLVYKLRDTEGRRYTQRDTPTFTAIYHPAEETLALWR